MDATTGQLLGGRVAYAQPVRGYRTGIEPVLLAASIPARAGETALEAGTGAGAGLLCLGARVPGVLGSGVELDPAMAALARGNLAANGLEGWPVLAADIVALARERRVGLVQHAFANPPWHDRQATPSPDAARALAKQERGTGIEGWIAVLGQLLRPGGSMTLIVPAAATVRTLAAIRDAGCGGIVLFPLWPKIGQSAKLALVQGHKGRNTPDRIAAGLVLHQPGGAYTDAADALLRRGDSLVL